MGNQICLIGWQIPKISLRLNYKIGSGCFGEVWVGLYKGTPVAIKSISPGIMNRDESLAEAIMMKELDHPNLIKLYGVCTMDVVEPIYIVMELMQYGSLQTFLQSKRSTLNLSALIGFAAQIACGMGYIGSKNYIHRDLAARNILVGDDGCNGFTIKIADFGLARFIKEDVYRSRVGALFPVKWTAPEAAKYKWYTIQSDVWSFGIVLMEIVTYGQEPYPGMDHIEVLNRVEQGYRMPCPPGCPFDLHAIMLKCWEQREMERPTFKTLQSTLEGFVTPQ